MATTASEQTQEIHWYSMKNDHPPKVNGTIAIVLLQDFRTNVEVEIDTWIDAPLLPPERKEGRWLNHGNDVTHWIPFPYLP